MLCRDPDSNPGANASDSDHSQDSDDPLVPSAVPVVGVGVRRPLRRPSVVDHELIQPAAVAPRSAVAGMLQEGLAKALPPKLAVLGSPDLHGDNATLRYRTAVAAMDWAPEAPDHDIPAVCAVCQRHANQYHLLCSHQGHICVGFVLQG